MLHEEVNAGFLELDGEGGLVGDALDDLEAFYVELESGGCAGIGSYLARDFEA